MRHRWAKKRSGLGIPYSEELAKFIFAARDVRFYRADGPAEDASGFGMRKPLLIADVKRRLFFRSELGESGGKVLASLEGVGVRRNV